MNLGIASDHRGVNQKNELIEYLKQKGYNVLNLGTDSDVAVDYPDYAILIGEKINSNYIDLGILICGTGIGMCIASNKVKGIRCAKVDNLEEAKLARTHNDANVISLSSSMDMNKKKEILDIFIDTSFNGEERHLQRIKKIERYENGN